MKQRIKIIFLVVLALLGCVIPVSAQTLIRVATPGALTGALPIYLGAKKGIFHKHGLNVEVIATRNEQMNMQALMSNSVQFLTSSTTGLFYLAMGLTICAVPRLIPILFFEPTFTGREEGLFRLVGWIMAVVGWFLWIGGRSGSRSSRE